MRSLTLLAALSAIVPPAIRDIGFNFPAPRIERDKAEQERRIAAAQAKRERKANKLKGTK